MQPNLFDPGSDGSPEVVSLLLFFRFLEVFLGATSVFAIVACLIEIVKLCINESRAASARRPGQRHPSRRGIAKPGHEPYKPQATQSSLTLRFARTAMLQARSPEALKRGQKLLLIGLALLTGVSAKAEDRILERWTPLSGIEGGSVLSLLVTGGRLYAGLSNAGVLVSADGGQTWEGSQTGLTDAQGRRLSVTALATSGKAIFAATSDGGAFRTTDGGRNWTAANDWGDANIPSVLALAASGAHVYAAAGGNAYVFVAAEQRWQRLNAQRITESELHALAVSGKCFCGAAGRADLFHSTDGGQSWSVTVLPVPQTDAAASGHSHSAGPPAASLSAPAVLTVAAKGNYVYVSTAQGQFVSTDCGGHWTPIPAAFLPRAYAFSGDHLYAASDAGVHLSTDHGHTWSSLTSNLDPGARVLALSGRLTLVATDGGVFADYRMEGTVASVSAASYEADAELAAEAIVSAFGDELAVAETSAEAAPLPVSLAGTQVVLRDSAGVERAAPLFFVSPHQINFQIPPGAALGEAVVTMTSGDGHLSSGDLVVSDVAPGLFSANSSGRGVAAGYVQRVRADLTQSIEPIAQFEASSGQFAARAIDLGPETDQVFLILFGTGIRSATESTTASIGGINVPVEYVGAQGNFTGLDQINLRLPRNLAGRGEVDVLITVSGKTANPVRISIR